MKKFSIKTLYLLCSVTLSIVSLFGINLYIKGKINPQDVWVFTRDMQANTKISDADIALVKIPKEAVKDNFIIASNSNEVVGKYLKTDVYANEYALQQHIVEKTEIDPFKSMDMSKLRKISIPGNMVETAGPIKKGDRVDLIYYGKIEKSENSTDSKEVTYGKVFMQNVPVYEVITGSGTTTTGPEDVPEGAEYNPFYENIVLAVTVQEAENILTRRSYGKVGLIARFEESESYKTEGFAINNPSSPDKLPFIGEAIVEKEETIIIDEDI